MKFILWRSQSEKRLVQTFGGLVCIYLAWQFMTITFAPPLLRVFKYEHFLRTWNNSNQEYRLSKSLSGKFPVGISKEDFLEGAEKSGFTTYCDKYRGDDSSRIELECGGYKAYFMFPFNGDYKVTAKFKANKLISVYGSIADNAL